MAIRIGGDPESYMEAPTLSAGGGGGGGPSFIASILDLLGVHRQVAKGPKEPKDAKKEIADQAAAATASTQFLPAVNPAGKSVNLSTPSLPILDHVGQAFAAPKVVSSDLPWMGGARPMPRGIGIIDPNSAY